MIKLTLGLLLIVLSPSIKAQDLKTQEVTLTHKTKAIRGGSCAHSFFIPNPSKTSTKFDNPILQAMVERMPEEAQKAAMAIKNSVTAKELKVGSVSTTPAHILAIFDSPQMQAILPRMPQDAQHLATAVKSIKPRFGLDHTTMIGDLYVNPKYRRQGYAKRMIQQTCENLFNNGVQTIALIPDPFEYKNGRQIPPNYVNKKANLVRLYTACGFINDNSGFMYRQMPSDKSDKK
jgi:GNAT superfamily N-acetyltransferase